MAVANKLVRRRDQQQRESANASRRPRRTRARNPRDLDSPLIPSDPLVWRKDLDRPQEEALRLDLRLRQNGTDEELDAQRKVLPSLQLGAFKKSDNNQLLPIRQMEVNKRHQGEGRREDQRGREEGQARRAEEGSSPRSAADRREVVTRRPQSSMTTARPLSEAAPDLLLRGAVMTVTARPSRAADFDVADPAPALAQRARSWLIWLTVAALLAWSWGPTEMHKIRGLFTDWRNMAEFASGFLRPNFPDWQAYVSEMIETVQIAIWATALAVFFGIRSPSWLRQCLPAMGRAARPPADGFIPRHPRNRFRAAVRGGGRPRPVAGVLRSPSTISGSSRSCSPRRSRRSIRGPSKASAQPARADCRR